MDPLSNFQYLDIHACWSSAARDLHRYATVVSAQGRLGDGPSSATTLRLTVHGVLQVCLLTQPRFRACADDEVCDWHRHPPHRFPCADRGRLIDTLADALLAYEDESQQDRSSLSSLLQRQLQQTTDTLQHVIQLDI